MINKYFLFILFLFVANVRAQPLPPAPAAPALSPTSINRASNDSDDSGSMDRGILEGIIEDYKYDAGGKRDPFLSYTAPRPLGQEEGEDIVSPLQRFDLEQLKLVGIIWNVKSPK